MKALENRATFYVPIADGGVTAERVAREATAIFGGATVIPAQGMWSGQAGVEVEGIALVIVHVEQRRRVEFSTFVSETAKNIGITLHQEAVAVDINGVLGIYEAGPDY